MSHFFQKIILAAIGLTLIIGLQTSCSSTYLLKKIIFAEEENKKFGEDENLKSSNWQVLNNSEVSLNLSINLFQYLHQNEDILLPYNALVLTSPPNV